MEKIYFRLNEKAASFDDPTSGLTLVPGQIRGVTLDAFNKSLALREARTGGHIIHVPDYTEEDEVRDAKKALKEQELAQAKADAGLSTDKHFNKEGQTYPPGEPKTGDDKVVSEQLAGIKKDQLNINEDKGIGTTGKEGTDEAAADEEEDGEGMTKAELLEAIKDSEDVPEDDMKGLSKKTKAELQKIYDKHVK